MKIVQTGVFFIDLKPTTVDAQVKQVRALFDTLVKKYGSDVILDDADTLDHISQLYVQEMSPLRIPLLVSATDEHGILVNNIELGTKTKIESMDQLDAYLDSLVNDTIVDVDGTKLSVDELKQLLHESKATVKSVTLGASLLNDSNVEHSEKQMLKDLYKKDMDVDDYVISFRASLTADRDLFDNLDKIDQLVVPASIAVRRELAQYIILNDRIQLIKLKPDTVPVIYMPDKEQAFSIFQLVLSDETVIEKWTSHGFELANRDKLNQALLHDSSFDLSGNLEKLPRLPTTDDPNGKKRQLMRGQNTELKDGDHFLDVLSYS